MLAAALSVSASPLGAAEPQQFAESPVHSFISRIAPFFRHARLGAGERIYREKSRLGPASLHRRRGFAVKLSTPAELGGAGGEGASPEPFSRRPSAGFIGALKVAGQQLKLKVPADTKVTATVGIGPRSTVVRGPQIFQNRSNESSDPPQGMPRRRPRLRRYVGKQSTFVPKARIFVCADFVCAISSIRPMLRKLCSGA